MPRSVTGAVGFDERAVRGLARLKRTGVFAKSERHRATAGRHVDRTRRRRPTDVAVHRTLRQQERSHLGEHIEGARARG